ncbi:DUF3885 domain-containing protein [Lysinibacillus sp. LZ02]|uniref:DUF3885 domain-containing protein n=1 Tax=Lysinibacillus sp. LZ02 TaxID=3420668 RepID=UPI003D36865B
MHTFNPRQLVPGFYHTWPFTLHIEFDEMYTQIDQIIEQIFHEKDELIVVVNTFPSQRKKQKSPRLLERFLKNKALKYTMTTNETEFTLDAERYIAVQFQLTCQVKDVYLRKLLYACAHADYRIHPYFKRGAAYFSPDVFIYNVTKETVLHVYDDRGCELMFQYEEMTAL